LEQAAERLKSVARDDISDLSRASKPIRKRRNRIIHFHAADLPDHPASPSKPRLENGGELFEDASDEVVQLVREQCVAWFELNKLLTSKWAPYFDRYQEKIDRLDRRMGDLRPYLKVRYAGLKPDIDKLVAAGTRVTECSACGFRANCDSEIFPGLVRSQCLVCRRDDRLYRYACQVEDCDGDVVVSDGDGGRCTACEKEVSIDDVIDALQPIGKPGDVDEWSRACCSYCESLNASGGSVIYLEKAARYLCFSCLEDFASVSSCEWCGESVTGDTNDSYMIGCLICEGRLGHERDR